MWAVTCNNMISCALLDSRQMAPVLQPSTCSQELSRAYSVPRCAALQPTDSFGWSNVNPMLSDKRPIVITMLATHKGAQISLLRLDGTF